MSESTSGAGDVTEFFGENVFGLREMRNYLSAEAYTSLVNTIQRSDVLDSSIADEVADAMKRWASEKGATHFTHWFQPLTGATAEKHDSFIVPDGEGGVILQFSGKELIQGEPDASSFPSGGLRATFEARGYTAWDPTSPAFIKEHRGGCTLCIPTVFCGYNGEALDKKTPLLRSMRALSDQVVRLSRLFGDEVADNARAFASLGCEQEYFLVDRELYEQRLDLVQTGRTLFGSPPAKHQQMDDHYFGAIRPRVIDFMAELDHELWRLGIPAKTRHNEVSPAQFEIAPVFEELNLAVDHNMMVMTTLEIVAERHGFACLLHEKPYAGVNGSGKHNNWNVNAPDGSNWFKPGATPHENAKFLTIICAVMKAVDTHAALLRCTVATAGNDHRLGANEAPPAIVSIFLGDQLSSIMAQLAAGTPTSSQERGTIQIGVSSLPQFPKDATDRNRTSPFAFTGNKFEFRAVGSSQSTAGSNVVLNTITAQAIDEMCIALESHLADGLEFNDALQRVMQDVATTHGRVLYDGDNYTQAWEDEAARRGLPNVRTTPDSLREIMTEKTVELFETYGVLSRREIKSRHDVYLEVYDQTIAIEANCSLTMARTMIAPAVAAYQRDLADTVNALDTAGLGEGPANREQLQRVTVLFNKMHVAMDSLEQALEAPESATLIAAMVALREPADQLEGLVGVDYWPLPSYAEMMFLI